MADEAAIHVIDDDEAIRDSLRFLFETSGLPVRTYESPARFLEVAAGLTGGCILTDLSMPDLDGLALQQQLHTLGVTLPLIVITAHGDVPLAVQALKSGAVDFIEKPFEDDQILTSAREALEEDRRQRTNAASLAQIATRIAKLTPRERDVLAGLVEGKPNKAIAYDLGSSPRTVEVHRARVMEKMHARSLPHLVRMVFALHPLGLPPAEPLNSPLLHADPH
jgi:two-component system, LuxR family, response regulator FixJ